MEGVGRSSATGRLCGLVACWEHVDNSGAGETMSLDPSKAPRACPEIAQRPNQKDIQRRGLVR